MSDCSAKHSLHGHPQELDVGWPGPGDGTPGKPESLSEPTFTLRAPYGLAPGSTSKLETSSSTRPLKDRALQILNPLPAPPSPSVTSSRPMVGSHSAYRAFSRPPGRRASPPRRGGRKVPSPEALQPSCNPASSTARGDSNNTSPLPPC